ncbi:c-type cytochrome [Pseudorhodoferax soli]|uniref:Mono/diheme cytochrome c family protein n=1 Tax=Pseudorhodoferax soli TaxID=545864 RepID=A0A368XMC8_9BURK|nr:cytochrome c [Pseudorhodoferax soli]RCW69161.1 mono/diheme cytochrome c family protein [Pseudorhodoferax soli]
MPPETEWLNQLIAALQAAQHGLLRLLGALGLVQPLDGQPAWPFALRLSGENLLIDLGQARRMGWTLAALALAALLVLLALLWRRGRWHVLAGVLLLLLAAPWPEARVLLVPATPASFHRSPTGFSAQAIVQGQALYAQHCLACHGEDGRGQGPLAAAQPVWPPNFSGPLLWRRADGDLWWHVLHGVRGRDGDATMAGFAGTLQADEAWALIDFIKAQGAGQALRAAGFWPQPVGLPDVAVQCAGQGARPLRSWSGQRVRVVAQGQGTVLEDPRFVTVLLRPSSVPAPVTAPDCVATDDAAWQAFALITGSRSFAGTQLLADRDGWARARAVPGQAGWSEDDLLCRTEGQPRTAQDRAPVDGLSALIAAMDAEPVRYVKGGFVH